MIVRNRLRYIRLSLHKDQDEFARMLDVNPWYVKRWEEQKIQPSLEMFCKIKDRLKKYLPDISLDDLIEYDAP
ncbi:MAG: helix-turn-helix transcriptional regulator [Thermoanaerobacteraceae bacterium]|nr:helix-turn-helix transcriptional regulator [Thermoanaerobacteraceae bacterium]